MQLVAAKKFVLVFITACIVVALVSGWCLLRWPNSTVVENKSTSPITDVTLKLTDLDGQWSSTRKIARLDPGQTLMLHHDRNDTAVELAYTLEGKNTVYRDPYVDLWSGDRWILRIDANGSVRSGYATQLDP